MRLRVLLMSAVAGILVSNGVFYESRIAAQREASDVFLGDASFSPSSLPQAGTSVLKVTVATGAEVPSVGADKSTPIRAVVQVAENSNFGRVSYQVTPSRVLKIPLEGGGKPSVGTLTFDSKDAAAGHVISLVTLIGLENHPSGVGATDPTSKEVTLSVLVPPPTPTPTPAEPPRSSHECRSAGWYWNYASGGGCTPQPACQLKPENCGRAARWDVEWCQCMPKYGSPIVIDVAGDGFRMTDVAGGVNFDLNGDGLFKERVAWTTADSDDAFLFLDRNEDKIVNNGVELFGDVTPQPYSSTPNGFVALGFYDTEVHGGNGDGIIDSGDAAYSQLRLWQDRNHNGVSEPNELHTLASLGVASVSLDFKESKQKDQHGNLFKYRARVEPVRRAEAAKWAWDVFLLSQ